MDIYDFAGLDGISLADAISQRFADCEPFIVDTFGKACWLSYSPNLASIRWSIPKMRPRDHEAYSLALQQAADPIIQLLACGKLMACGVAEGVANLPEWRISPNFFRTRDWVLHREGSRLVDLLRSGRENRLGCSDVRLAWAGRESGKTTELTDDVISQTSEAKQARAKPLHHSAKKSAAVRAAIAKEWPKGIPGSVEAGARDQLIQKRLKESGDWDKYFKNTKYESFQSLVQRLQRRS